MPSHLETQLNHLDASMSAYLGLAGEKPAGGRGLGCVLNQDVQNKKCVSALSDLIKQMVHIMWVRYI